MLFVSALPGVVVKVRASRALYAWRRARTEDERRAWYYQSMLIDGAYAKEARLFGFGDTVRGWFRGVRARLREGARGAAAPPRRGGLAAQALRWCRCSWPSGTSPRTPGGPPHAGGPRPLLHGRAARVSAFLQELLSGLAGLYEDNLFLSSFEEFLALPSRVKDPERPRAA